MRTRAQRQSKKHLHGVHLLCSDICILTGSTVPALGGALRRRCVFLLDILTVMLYNVVQAHRPFSILANFVSSVFSASSVL